MIRPNVLYYLTLFSLISTTLFGANPTEVLRTTGSHYLLVQAEPTEKKPAKKSETSQEENVETKKEKDLEIDSRIIKDKEGKLPPVKVVDSEEELKLEKKSAPIIQLMRASEGEFLSPAGSKEGVVIFKGGILIKIGSRSLEAETVKINARTGEIYGEGGIKLNDGIQEIKGDRFIYDYRNQQGVVYKADTYLKPIYYMGERIKQVSDKAFLVSMAFFTTCEAKPIPHFHFKASKVWIYEDDQIMALNVWMYVGTTRVFYIPALFETEIGTGIITQFGKNRTRGYFLQNTYYYGFPGASKSSLLPDRGKFMFDWYQKLGEYVGTKIWKESANLNYNIDVGIARFKQREDLPFDVIDPGRVEVTNFIGSDNQVVSEFWWKAKTDIRASWNRSHQYDSASQIYVRFEHYRNQHFEREFGQRFEPDNTFEAINIGNAFAGGVGKRDLLWQATYIENWQDNSLSVEVSRNLVWKQETNADDSRYVPTYDLAPKVAFAKRFRLIEPKGDIFAGGWANISLDGSINRYYSDGAVLKTIFSGNGLSQFSLYFPFYRWLSFTPSLGYGFAHQFARQADAALEQETQRASFQYLFTQDNLRLGYPILYTQVGYEYRVGFDQGFVDPTFGNVKAHNVNISVVSDNNPYSFVSARTRRDLRPYPYRLPEAARWAPLDVEGQLNYDFVHGFAINYFGLRKRKRYHFWGIGISDSYRYLIRFNKSESNDVSLYMRLGGYKLPFLRELVSLKMGYTWHHDFIDIRQDVMTFSWQIDLLLHRYWRLNMGANSRALEVDRYQSGHPQHVNFFTDLGRSLNAFNQADRNQAIFNLENFYAILEHNLHRWVMRLSYTINRRTFFFGEGLTDRATFFEQTIYFSMNLKDFTGFGIPRTRLLHTNPSEDLL